MGFSRQEYWSGLPFPSPRDPPNPGIKLRSPALQTHALPPEPLGKPKDKDGFRDTCDYHKRCNVCGTGVPEEKENRVRLKNNFYERMAENSQI